MDNNFVQIVAQALNVTIEIATICIQSSTFQISQPYPNSMWFSFADSQAPGWKGLVVSAYNHPTRKHYATTIGKSGTIVAEAEQGQWAVSKQVSGTQGKAKYKTEGL
ncbi:hypothetical protein pb186bvf_002270 [Paramecium bursaria]